MIEKLEGRDKIAIHKISNKVNEIIDFINSLGEKGEENSEDD